MKTEKTKAYFFVNTHVLYSDCGEVKNKEEISVIIFRW